MDASPISVARQLGRLMSDVGVDVISADAFGLKDSRRAEGWQADSGSVALTVMGKADILDAVEEKLTAAGAKDVRLIRGACRGMQLRFGFTDATASSITSIDLSGLRSLIVQGICPVCSDFMKASRTTCSRRCAAIHSAKNRKPRSKKASA